MPTLFLTSLKNNLLPTLLDKPVNETKIAFIPTAADLYEDKGFMEADRKQLSDSGFILKDVDLKNKNISDLRKEFAGCEIIYISGGNTFYLLQEAVKSGFNILIQELVGMGVIYAGASAGAILAGPTIEPVITLDDPSIAKDLKSFRGFGLTDLVILPHYGKPEYEQNYQDIIKRWGHSGLKLIPLTDEQSIVVKDGEYQVLQNIN